MPNATTDARAIKPPDNNPGADSRWCPVCCDTVANGLAHVQRHGDRASQVRYTAHCYRCGAPLENTKPGGGY